MGKQSKIVWQNGENLFVIRVGKTTNDKIATKNEVIIQTYTFSLKQFELVKNNDRVSHKEFFDLDGSNCLDCPLRGSAGKCYTHKMVQFSGFVAMLRSVAKMKKINKTLTSKNFQDIVEMSEGKFIRFGSYGEPSLLPIKLVKSMTEVAKSWTGYTHQSHQKWAKKYSEYFMASAHGEKDVDNFKDWLSFVMMPRNEVSKNLVTCPASKESGFISNCSKCALCSGHKGKGSKHIQIQTH